jgi:hypothetical protein
VNFIKNVRVIVRIAIPAMNELSGLNELPIVGYIKIIN